MTETETKAEGQKPKTRRLTVRSLVLAISVILCLAFCVVLLVLVRARLKQPRPRIIYAALERYVDKEQAKTVRLADLTDFDWDYLYAFPPYTGERDVSSVIGEKLVITKEHRYHLNDGDVLVAFTYNGKLVYHEFFPPKYRLFGIDGSFMIPKQKAVFKVSPLNTGGGPYKLQQIDSR